MTKATDPPLKPPPVLKPASSRRQALPPVETHSDFAAPQKINQFRVYGFLQGEYLPSEDHPRRGIIKTTDGEIFPAFVDARWAKAVKKGKFSGVQIWWCYPKPDKEATWRFQLLAKLDPEHCEGYQNVKDNLIDRFSIRGHLWGWDEDSNKVAIKVMRNEPKPVELIKALLFLWKPVYLNLQGQILSEKHKGELWDLICVRKGKALVIEAGKLILKAQKPKDKGRKGKGRFQKKRRLPPSSQREK